jgi:hypothetical protein
MSSRDEDSVSPALKDSDIRDGRNTGTVLTTIKDDFNAAIQGSFTPI